MSYIVHRGHVLAAAADRSPGRPGVNVKGAIVMAWTSLFLAGLLEIVWASLMKYSQGFTRLWPSIATLAFMAASFGLLAVAMRTLPLGTAYAVWTGIGAAGAFIVGVTLFHEPATVQRVLAASMIVGGIVLMKMSG